jgi:hypothetical protein
VSFSGWRNPLAGLTVLDPSVHILGHVGLVEVLGQ